MLAGGARVVVAWEDAGAEEETSARRATVWAESFSAKFGNQDGYLRRAAKAALAASPAADKPKRTRAAAASPAADKPKRTRAAAAAPAAHKPKRTDTKRRASPDADDGGDEKKRPSITVEEVPRARVARVCCSRERRAS